MQNRELSLGGLERIMMHAQKILFLLEKSPGAQEGMLLGREEIDAEVLAAAQLWRRRLCRTLRAKLRSRWAAYPCRRFCSFFVTSEDVTTESLMALASALGHREEDVYAVGMRWCSLRQEFAELSGTSLRNRLLRFVIENEEAPDLLHNMIECILVLSPSSVFLEAAFSVVNRHRGKHRRSASATTLAHNLVCALHLPTDVAKRTAVAREVVDDFLLQKPRRFTLCTAKPITEEMDHDTALEFLFTSEDPLPGLEEQDDWSVDSDVLSIASTLASATGEAEEAGLSEVEATERRVTFAVVENETTATQPAPPLMVQDGVRKRDRSPDDDTTLSPKRMCL